MRAQQLLLLEALVVFWTAGSPPHRLQRHSRGCALHVPQLRDFQFRRHELTRLRRTVRTQLQLLDHRLLPEPGPMRFRKAQAPLFECTACAVQLAFDESLCTYRKAPVLTTSVTRNLLLDDRWLAESSRMSRVLGVASKQDSPHQLARGDCHLR